MKTKSTQKQKMSQKGKQTVEDIKVPYSLESNLPSLFGQLLVLRPCLQLGPFQGIQDSHACRIVNVRSSVPREGPMLLSHDLAHHSAAGCCPLGPLSRSLSLGMTGHIFLIVQHRPTGTPGNSTLGKYEENVLVRGQKPPPQRVQRAEALHRKTSKPRHSRAYWLSAVST